MPNREKSKQVPNYAPADDERRSRILSAAQNEFARLGFQKAEVKSIAIAASVGKATIYKYFAPKEDLLLTIVEENLLQLRDIGLAAIMQHNPPIERLRAAIAAMANHMETHRDFCNVLIQEAGDFKGDIQKHHIAIVEYNLPLADAFFSTLRKQGHFNGMTTREAFQMFIDIFIGAVYSWAITESEEPLEKRVLRYIDILLLGASKQ